MSFEGSKAVLIKDLSGNVLSVAGGAITATADISGDPVSVSGNVVIALVSGQTISQAGSIFRIRVSGYLPVTDASGGASVGSGTVMHGVTLRNVSGSVNGVIWIGGSGTNLSPFSGHGQPLLTEDTLTLPITNFLSLRAVANISGVLLAATGVDF